MPWPNGAKVACAITFDMDADSLVHIEHPKDCAESRGMAAYENAAYPNRLTINVPAIAAGKVHNHKLRFWKDLDWQPGAYNFVLEADVAKTVGETNESNNFGGAVLTKP